MRERQEKMSVSLLHHSTTPLFVSSFSPMIQVSLLPPPCEELTTSEPARSATRVRPPGMIVTFSPYRMKGRRSTCRPCMRSSQKAGARERDDRLRDVIARILPDLFPKAFAFRLRRLRADEHSVTATFVHGLNHEL